jgi:hypothetical protein
MSAEDAAAKKRAVPRGAERSPHFNRLPRLPVRVSEERENRRVVRQPPILPLFQKPLRPLGRKAP